MQHIQYDRHLLPLLFRCSIQQREEMRALAGYHSRLCWQRTTAKGKTRLRTSGVRTTFLRVSANHESPMQPPTKNWTLVAVRGYIHILRSCLL
jgi:hypothetical protein